MEKLCKKLTAFVLVLCMLFSLNLWAFANSNLPTYTYTNTDAVTLKALLNEYVNTEQESAIFYNQSCKLSTGEEGFCYIGYDADAKAFYIQCIDSTSNPNFRWCYKYDTDYAWKYNTYHSSGTNWIEVDSFGIEFVGRTYSSGSYLDLTDLDERCQMLFKENDGTFPTTVNYTYKMRSADELNSFLEEGVEGDIIYAFAKFDFESEPFYCKISSESYWITIERFVNGSFEPYYEYSKSLRKWYNVEDDSTVDEIYVRLNCIRSVENSDAFNKILKCLNKPYYPVNNQRLNIKRVDAYIEGGKTLPNIYSGYIELSTGEIGFGVIGWSYETGCFYIQMRTNNPDGKWSYKFTEFEGTPKWKYRDINSDDDFADIEQFYIRFYDRSSGQYKECPSELSFMFSDGDFPDDYFLEDGVYKIKNVYNGLYLDVTDGGTTSGTAMQQWSGTSTDNNLNQLFKITYLETRQGLNYYSIRPMINSGMGLYASTAYTPSTATVEDMTHIDSMSIPYSQCWAITQLENEYTIKNGEPTVSSYLTAPLNSTNGSQISTSDSISTNSQWIFEAYTGADLNGAGLNSASYNLICGETFDYDAYMYSSEINTNGPVRYLVKDIDGSDTDKATIDSSTGELTALKSGQIQLRVTYSASPYIWCWNVMIEESMEGTYLLNNVEYTKYMQIDDNSSTFEDEAIMELWSFDNASDQRWNIEYVVEGYYKIISVASGKAITAPSNSNEALVQTDYTGSTTQQWRITSTENGTYKISPRSNESNYMAVGDGIIFSDGRNVELRANQSDNKDEWYLMKIEAFLPIELEGQQKSLWCWAATARMFAKNYCSSVTATQSDAVKAVKNIDNDDNVGGNKTEAVSAINFYASTTLDTNIIDYKIYSEQTMKQFLDDGHVIYISRGQYSDFNDPTSRYNGHAFLITAYLCVDGDCWFIAQDPWPEDVGSSYLISYEKLVNGSNSQGVFETSDLGVWDGAITINTSYSTQTIPYYFG